jgi:hypothetical protein
VAAQNLAEALGAAIRQMRVERREAIEHRNRHLKVPPRIADQPFDLAFVVAFGWAAEPILEQVVRLQLCEHACPRALAIAKDLGHRNLGIVVED